MQSTPDDFSSTAKLAAKVAHELNNPLDAVLRFISLAQHKARAGQFGDLERHLSDAQFGLQRMAEILRELMEIGREANTVLSQSRPLPLREWLQHALDITRPIADAKHSAFQINDELPSAKQFPFDPRLLQILVNLLRNAIDASPTGAAIDIRLSRVSEAQLSLTVADAGPGIPPQLLSTLFTPFITSKPKGEGHGLGLAISRELARSLGGDLSLSNNMAPANGCTATLLLPAQPTSAGAA